MPYQKYLAPGQAQAHSNQLKKTSSSKNYAVPALSSFLLIRKDRRRKMERCTRPNRSDVHVSKEEEAKLEESTRDYFDAMAPKRHTKPQRSDYSKTYTDSCSDDVIPEHVRFQLLENDPQKLGHTNGSQATEEFVETEYYKDLNCIDKQHHTTGTGFIAIESMKGKSFSLEPDSATDYHGSCKGNPATNEWIPAAADEAGFVSDKPKRSDN